MALRHVNCSRVNDGGMRATWNLFEARQLDTDCPVVTLPNYLPKITPRRPHVSARNGICCWYISPSDDVADIVKGDRPAAHVYSSMRPSRNVLKVSSGTPAPLLWINSGRVSVNYRVGDSTRAADRSGITWQNVDVHIAGRATRCLVRQA
jgi:hypothetical protein